MSGRAPLIDRLLAPLGARSLVAVRPGMGWLLLEIVPAVVWMQITGAQSLEGYYLVQLMKHYGAPDGILPLLPLVGCMGSAVGALAVFLQRTRDPKRGCMQMTWPGRSIFLGTVLWPPLAWAMGLGTTAVLVGVLGCFFACQVLQIASAAQWVAWTQTILPREATGRFHAWRCIAAFLCTAAAMQLIAWTYPGAADPLAERNWLMLVYGCATVIGILGAWPLQLAPDMPPTTGPPPPRTPLLHALTHQPGIRRLLGWSAMNAACFAIAMAYLPRWLDSCGIAPGRMALGQSFAFMPAMLVGVLLAGWCWNRLGGARGLLLVHVLMVTAEGSYLLLSPANAGWLLFPALALAGFGRGVLSVGVITRMQELFPGGDPRVPAVAMGVGGLAGAGTAVGLLFAFPHLTALRELHPALPVVPWLLLSGAVALRIVATPLALPPRR
jgi:hypothetical protein